MLRTYPGLIIAVFVVFSTGCAIAPRQTPEPPAPPPQETSKPEPRQTITKAPAEGVSRQAEGTAVVALIEQSETQQQSGELEQAASSIERGLRIEPRNARLWQRLAELRLQQGDAQQAEVMAGRSNDFAYGNEQLLQHNWQIIADARRLQGNEQGAEKAAKKAANYRD